MMKETMEIRFNGIYNKVIPLILFSPKSKRDVYADLLSGLFDAMIARDYDVFERVYKKLESLVEIRDRYDSKKETLINSFLDMNKSLDKKIREHDKVIIEMKKYIKKINNNRNLINSHYRELKNIEKNQKNEEVSVKNKEEIKKQSESRRYPERQCPIKDCSGHLNGCGSKRGIKRVQCSVCNKSFPKKDEGDFFYCKHCGGILSGWGDVVKCIDCGKKNRIAGKPNLGKYKLKCPDCKYEWWYNGSAGINESVTCPSKDCHKHFILKNKHILEVRDKDE